MNPLDYATYYNGIKGAPSPISGYGGLTLEQLQAELAKNNYGQPNTKMYGDPFGTAMSGNQANTLQPYLNKQNDNAYRALNGGLLGYSHQPMTAGNATGGATMATGAQGGMPAGLLAGAGGQLAQTGQLDPLQLALQNRSWMKNNG